MNRAGCKQTLAGEKGKNDVLHENIMGDVLNAQNLSRAYRAVRRNKGAAGVDGMTTTQLGEHLRKHWAGTITESDEDIRPANEYKQLRLPTGSQCA